jgi:hypothetical protein
MFMFLWCCMALAANTDITPIAKSKDPHKDEKRIIITNAIEPSMLEYNYWGTHSPEKFIVRINDTEIKQGAAYELPAQQTEVTVKYDYSFAGGLYKGSKITTYKVDDSAKEAQLTFSWTDEWHTIMSNVQPIKQLKSSFEDSTQKTPAPIEDQCDTKKVSDANELKPHKHKRGTKKNKSKVTVS